MPRSAGHSLVFQNVSNFISDSCYGLEEKTTVNSHLTHRSKLSGIRILPTNQCPNWVKAKIPSVSLYRTFTFNSSYYIFECINIYFEIDKSRY